MPVIKYQEFMPHRVLQDHVKRFWILEKEYTAEDSVEEVTPDACVELILNSDRPHLRPILDAIIHAAAGLGKVVVQARKGYVSLVAPGRTFARVQATTKDRIDLCLRLKNQPPAGLLCPSKRHEHMDHEIRLTATDELHSEVLRWLQEAYKQNS
jgi:hypothetical protein